MSWLNNLPTWMGGTDMNTMLAANPELLKMNNAASYSSTLSPIKEGQVSSGGSLFGGLFDNFFDTTNANGIKTQGWGGLAIQGLQGLGNSYMGMKQFGLAEDALKEQKRQFNTNFEAQRKMTNSQLSDRQRARVASNAGAYQSEAEYMKQWGI